MKLTAPWMARQTRSVRVSHLEIAKAEVEYDTPLRLRQHEASANGMYNNKFREKVRRDMKVAGEHERFTRKPTHYHSVIRFRLVQSQEPQTGVYAERYITPAAESRVARNPAA